MAECLIEKGASVTLKDPTTQMNLADMCRQSEKSGLLPLLRVAEKRERREREEREKRERREREEREKRERREREEEETSQRQQAAENQAGSNCDEGDEASVGYEIPLGQATWEKTIQLYEAVCRKSVAELEEVLALARIEESKSSAACACASPIAGVMEEEKLPSLYDPTLHDHTHPVNQVFDSVHRHTMIAPSSVRLQPN